MSLTPFRSHAVNMASASPKSTDIGFWQRIAFGFRAAAAMTISASVDATSKYQQSLNFLYQAYPCNQYSDRQDQPRKILRILFGHLGLYPTKRLFWLVYWEPPAILAHGHERLFRKL